MRGLFKSTTSLVLFILFLVACFVGVVLVFILAWLHTYKVFTRQTPIAEVVISARKQDSLGDYADVKITQVKGRSPLTNLFNPYDQTTDELETPLNFKVYGDYVEVGGPIMKFEDILTLFNFQTIYKVALVNGFYENPDKERERTQEMFSRFELNGGYGDWRSIYEDFNNPTSIRGNILKIFIDSVPQLDPKGVPVISREQTLVLCITDKGFFFCDQPLRP